MNPILTPAERDVYCSSNRRAFTGEYWDVYRLLLQAADKDGNIPDLYKANVVQPFTEFIEKKLGEQYFNHLFSTSALELSKEDRYYKKIVPEVAEAIFQMAGIGGHYTSSLKDISAFQSVVSILFQRVTQQAANRASLQVLAPMAKWGTNTRGPYTYPAKRINKHEFRVGTGVVNLPLEHRSSGLLAWSALGHEVAGHNFLGIYPQITKDLAASIKEAISAAPDLACDQGEQMQLADYWSVCAEEIICDVLGVLTTGPSAIIGLISYLRGRRRGVLRSKGLLHSSTCKPTRELSVKVEGVVLKTIASVSKNISFEDQSGILGKVKGTRERVEYEKHYIPQGKHPLDILRPCVQLAVLDHILGFPDRNALQAALDANLPSDHKVHLYRAESSEEEVVLGWACARASAEIVAQTIIYTPVTMMDEKQQLLEIVPCWNQDDENKLNRLRELFCREQITDAEVGDIEDLGKLSAHIVACAVREATLDNISEDESQRTEKIERLFQNMKLLLHADYQQYLLQNPGGFTRLNFLLSPAGEDDQNEDPLCLFEEEVWH